MAQTRYTVAELTQKVRWIADLENATTRVDDGEIAQYLWWGLGKLYAMLVDSTEWMSVETGTITGTGVDTGYDMPWHFRLISVEKLDGSNYVPLKRLHWGEVPYYQAQQYTNPSSGTQVPAGYTVGNKFQLAASDTNPATLDYPKLYLWPSSSAGTFRIRYIKNFLSYGGTTGDDGATKANADAYRFPHGWEEYVVLEEALRCKVKEGADITGIALLLADVKQRIQEEIRAVDQNNPAVTLVARP
jgi:hypothetical protein